MKHIDIFTTKYVINISKVIERNLNKLGYKTTLNERRITNDDISLLNENNDRLMFIMCIQWVYNKNLNLLPKNKYIIYQLEQLDRKDCGHMKNDFIRSLLKNSYHIFDYSNLNIKYFYEEYLDKVSFLMPPVIDHNDLVCKKIYDILFVGSVNEKRNKILMKLHNCGFNVKVVSNVFGEELQELIKKSRIYLNIRYSDSNILETVRIHEAILSKDTYIISEFPKTDVDDIHIYKKRIVFVEPDNIEVLIKAIKITLKLCQLRPPLLVNSEEINHISFKNLNAILPFLS